jgi:mono/diheme cytochrome c family protein/glucose/arabinose dehydrogenase
VIARLLVSTLCLFAHVASADLPPPPPVLSPAEELQTFQIAEPGYRIELVACEPMAQDPVAVQFDGEGRLWVVEMRSYMQDIDGNGAKDPIGRISVLQDTDGDGLMDTATVFLDDLVLPRAIAILPDGVLVAENKPLWFVRDTDGDLVADEKTLVDKNYAKDNIEHSANGLLRAMDNWIYNAKEGHRYRRDGNRWIREETEQRGQWGICQDNQGRLFYNYNHSQLHVDFVPANTLTRNPNHQPSTGLSVGVTASNSVFPNRPNLATNRGYIPGALDDNGRIQQFTSACAPFVYREATIEDFRGNAFVCETAGNLVKRNRLSHSGISVTGTSAYPDRDFLASTDERFRPCWITTGPDGALYIADMYRGIVQDAPHMSPYLREHSIARAMEQPIHRGRIWRIVPDDFQQSKPPSFSKMDAFALVETLSHPSGWWRDQAQTHLVERDLQEAIPSLREMALSHDNELARLHALWALEGFAADQPEALLPVLEDTSAIVRGAAIRVLASLGLDNDQLYQASEKVLAGSPAEADALQWLLTLGELKIKNQERFDTMSAWLLPRIVDPLMRDAALSSLHGREVHFLERIWKQLDPKNQNPGAAIFVEAISRAVVQSRDAASIAAMLNFITDPSDDWRQQALLSGVQIHGPSLLQEPVKLVSAPKGKSTIEAVARFFSWPGHTPPPPPKSSARPLNKAEQKRFVRGRQIYLTSCVACHGSDGKGMKLLAPPLAGSDWVQGSEQRLVRVLLHGLSGPITVAGKRYATPEIQPLMPPLASLDNGDIAAVLTYIRREWDNAADPISTGDVNRLRIEAQGRTIPWTEEELQPFAAEP